MNIFAKRTKHRQTNRLHKSIMALLPALFCLMQSPAYADINLIFGTYTADKPTDTLRKFKPFLKYLSKKMSVSLNEPVKISMKIASNYRQGVSDLVDGHVDFSRFGPASYVTAKNQDRNIQIIAMESKKGKKTFKGLVLHLVTVFLQSVDIWPKLNYWMLAYLVTIWRVWRILVVTAGSAQLWAIRILMRGL